MSRATDTGGDGHGAHGGIAALQTLPTLVLFGFLIAFAIYVAQGLLESGTSFEAVLGTAKRVVWRFWRRVFLDPLVVVGVPFLFLLQVLLPARPDEKSFGAPMRVDVVFTVGMMAFSVVVAPAFFSFSRFVFDHTLGHASIDFTATASALPGWAQMLLGYLAVDFLGWFHHLVRHHVPGFWEFHAVHHGQRVLNPFTNERVHPVDWLASNTIKFLPAFWFEDSLGIVLKYIYIHSVLDRLNHSNVRTNLGWLRYVLVTPQSHRVHHSSRPKHADTNFGVSLSLWDHLFGTQYRGYDEYPETGVQDPGYPQETDGSARGVLLSLWREFLYPFPRALGANDPAYRTGRPGGGATFS